jgi:hypothetical protein
MASDKTLQDLHKLLDESVTKLESSIPKIEKQVFDKLVLEVSKLETDLLGNIKPNVSNLKSLQKIKSSLSDIILSPEYVSNVGKFINTFDKSKELIDDYFFELVNTFDNKKALFNEILSNSVSVTEESLLGAGVTNDIITPITDYLSKSVTQGQNLTELIDELSIKIKGYKTNLGYIQKNVKQIATDSINQYSANYTQSISDDLDFEYYLYSGANKITSRCFCLEREGKYFSKKEIEYWGSTPSLWNTCKTKVYKGGGRIPSTDKKSIFTYRGGYQCNHLIMPVSELVVPKEVIERNS